MTGGMMFKGTPGEWYAGDNYIRSYRDGDTYTVLEVLSGNVNDVNIVSAAPDLLEALINIIPAAETGSERSSPIGYFDHRIEAARAAIAKALGEKEC